MSSERSCARVHNVRAIPQLQTPMSPRLQCLLAVAALSVCSPVPARSQQAADLGVIAKVYLAHRMSTDWDGVEKLAGFRWAPLPPTSLNNCLPNGDCFARAGKATIGGRELAVMASGARTIVTTILLRNLAAPFGEAAVLAALTRVGITPEVARCPVKASAGATSWYRLNGERLVPGFISMQPATPGRPGEGFVLIRGEDLPALQPNQLALYSEQCARGAERKAVATSMPQESIAQAVVALLAPASGAPLYDWQSLKSLVPDIRWLESGPTAVDLRSQGDPNPMMQSGSVAWGGRNFSVMATGTSTTVKAIHLDEQGLHPKGEHMLGVVYAKGITVRKVRCGPVYTESTNDWYALTSAATRPANIRQSIRYDGNQVQDAYELRLDATLPVRDPRDRNPGVNGC